MRDRLLQWGDFLPGPGVPRGVPSQRLPRLLRRLLLLLRRQRRGRVRGGPGGGRGRPRRRVRGPVRGRQVVGRALHRRGAGGACQHQPGQGHEGALPTVVIC